MDKRYRRMSLQVSSCRFQKQKFETCNLQLETKYGMFAKIFPFSIMVSHKFFRTSDSWSPLVLRVALGGVMLVHGLQKLGVLEGGSIDGTVQFMGSLGVPALIAYLVILSESVGSLALILGFATRFSAAACAVIMLGAIFLVHWPNGFSMGNGGYEFHLVALGAAVALALAGGGKWSLDKMLSK